MPADAEADDDERRERDEFRDGRNVLDELTVTQAAAIGPGQERNDRKRDELSSGKRDGVMRGDAERRNDIARFRNSRPQHTTEAGESDGNGSDGAGLDHAEESPAIEESGNGRKRFAQIDVHAAGAGQHGGEFT